MSYTPTALQAAVYATWATLQGTGFDVPLGYSRVDNDTVALGEYAVFTLVETDRERMSGGDLIMILLTFKVYGGQSLDYEAISAGIRDGFTLAALKGEYTDSNIVELKAGVNEVSLDPVAVEGEDVGLLTATFELVVQS